MGIRKHPEKHCENKIDKYLKKEGFSKLYKERYINWKGSTRENTLYENFFANLILKEFKEAGKKAAKEAEIAKLFEQPEPPFFKHSRNDKEGKGEEKVQRDFYLRNRAFPKSLGELFWFELALKTGKGVDLVSVDHKNEKIYLIELKIAGNKESVLKAILEIESYYQTVIKHETLFFKSLKEFKGTGNAEFMKAREKISDSYTFKKVLLLPENGEKHKKLLEDSKHEKCIELLRYLEIEVATFKEN
jgi:hypothetical protein